MEKNIDVDMGLALSQLLTQSSDKGHTTLSLLMELWSKMEEIIERETIGKERCYKRHYWPFMVLQCQKKG